MYSKYTLCLKKVPTIKLSVTLSNVRADFQSVCTAGKRMKFATKPTQRYPPHLRHVATLPWDIKNSFLQIFSRYRKMQRNCIYIAPILIPLRAYNSVCWVYVCVFKNHNLVLVAECHVDCLIVNKHCSDVCCDEFPMLQTDRKSKQVKEQWHRKFFLQSVWERTRYLDT